MDRLSTNRASSPFQLQQIWADNKQLILTSGVLCSITALAENADELKAGQQFNKCFTFFHLAGIIFEQKKCVCDLIFKSMRILISIFGSMAHRVRI